MMRIKIFNPLNCKTIEIDLYNDDNNYEFVTILEKKNVILKRFTNICDTFEIHFSKKKNIKTIRSNDLELLKLIFYNVLIIVPYYDEFKFLYYLNNENMNLVISNFPDYKKKDHGGFKLISFKSNDFILIATSNDGLLYLNINDALALNEYLIENKNEILKTDFP